MNKKLIISTLMLLSASSFAADSINTGLTSCKFSNKSSAINYARAIDGDTRAASMLNKADLSQVESCSTAITIALRNGISYDSIASNVNTKGNLLENGIEATIELVGVDSYKVDGKVLSGNTSIIDQSIKMVITVEGERNEVTHGVPTLKTENNIRMEVLSKDEVRLIDDEAGINTIVKARVKKSLFGRVKGISISSKELETALKPVLDALGLNLARELKINTKEGSFSMDYKVSSLECEEVEKKELECSSSFLFKMSVQFK